MNNILIHNLLTDFKQVINKKNMSQITYNKETALIVKYDWKILFKTEKKIYNYLWKYEYLSHNYK